MVSNKYFAQILGTCDELNLPNCDNSPGLSDILGIVFMVVGALSVVFIIIGGIRYVLSGGNPESTRAAGNTILYAVVGLIVSIFAFAIVRFVAGGVS